MQIRPCRKERESSFLCAYIQVLLVTVARVHVRSRDLAITWQLKPKYSFSFSVSEHTGETEDEAEPKRTGKKESRKRDARTPAAAAAAPAPPPGSPVRGQRKGAQSFFAELRAELQGGPAAPPAGAGAAASRSRERVAVVRFCSRRRTGGQQPHPHGDTKVRAGGVPGRGETAGGVVSGDCLCELCRGPQEHPRARGSAEDTHRTQTRHALPRSRAITAQDAVGSAKGPAPGRAGPGASGCRSPGVHSRWGCPGRA